jgi:hypothetical protein
MYIVTWPYVTRQGTSANTANGVSLRSIKSNQRSLRVFVFAHSTDTLVNTMTGSNALPFADEAASDGSAQWAGVAKVVGPPWARFPAITVGLAGVQVMWSIEMAYGEQLYQNNPISALNDPEVV